MESPGTATADSSSSGRKRRWNGLARFAVLIGVLALLLPAWTSGLPARAVPSLSFYVVVVSAVAVRAVGFTAILAVIVMCLAMRWPRWFCRYGCPTGLLLDLTARLRGRPKRRGMSVPLIGRWLLLLALGSACLSYPLMLWLDPLALLSGFVNAIGQHSASNEWLAGAGLPLLLLLTLVWPHVWCRKLCPLGAAQDLLTLSRHAVTPARRAQPAARSEWKLMRRTALGVGFGMLGATAAARKLFGARRPVLRPPGAADAEAFGSLCVRCGNCGRACPTRIIHPDVTPSTNSWLAPMIRFDDRYCLETCRKCMEVCPTGALRPIAEAEKPRARIGLPHVDMEICLLGDDRECSLCRTHCPYNAIRFVFSEKDYYNVPQVDRDRCNGCGVCQVICPTSPRKAIVVQPVSM